MSLASSASRPSVVALAPRRRRALLPSSSRVALPLPLPTRRASSTPMPPERAKRDASAAAAASDATYVPGEEIKNAVVVVTGANRGIGLEFVSQILAKHPSNAVIATSRDATSCVDLLALRESFGDARLAVTTLDVADEASIASWAAAVRDLPLVRANGGAVDVVINNAGTTGTCGYDKWELEDMTSDEMMHVFKINTIGPLLVTQRLLKAGVLGTAGVGERPRGALVGNVTSKVGSVDDNGSGSGYAYRASKAALNIVNKSMSIDLADRGVLCELLHPGWVRTRMTQGRGLIDAEESARGLIAAMEGKYGEVNGRWYDYKGDEIPW